MKYGGGKEGVEQRGRRVTQMRMRGMEINEGGGKIGGGTERLMLKSAMSSTEIDHQHSDESERSNSVLSMSMHL